MMPIAEYDDITIVMMMPAWIMKFDHVGIHWSPSLLCPT